MAVQLSKRISANVKVLKTRTTKVKVFGFEVTETQLVLMIMVNVEAAQQSMVMTEYFPAPSKHLQPVQVWLQTRWHIAQEDTRSPSNGKHPQENA